MQHAIQQISIQTDRRCQMVEITSRIKDIVTKAHVADGHVVIYVPHTTAGITINENADPDVVSDVLEQLDRMVPDKQPFYQHAEGNSASHVKAILTGSSVCVLIHDGRLVLGRWQGIFFCEYDGPRTRTVIVRISGA